MSRKYRPNKRRRTQTFAEQIESVVLDGGDDTRNVAFSKEDMQVDVSELARPETIQLDGGMDGGEQPEESEEELKRKQEMWEVFQEEQHEGTCLI